tara:strand:+ start:1056 stop:1490 length:435 start_codon:yes stop_codon:yes gene_type:complete
MTATIIVNNKGFFSRFTTLRKRYASRINHALDIAAQVATRRIVERTGRGQQINKAGFKKYTSAYEASKRNMQGVNFRGVNLQVTNDMLGSITNTQPTNHKTTIFFGGAKQAKKAFVNQKTRPFFGLNRDDHKEIRKVFGRELFR